MARGGYRPGSGRKKGQKDSKKRKKRTDHEEIEKIKEILSLNLKAKAKLYSNYLQKVQKGEKISTTEINLMNKVERELREEITPYEKNVNEETPLEYMLRIMNDASEDKDRRDKMACAAAPFVHTRKGEGIGKKQEKEERAKEASQGIFSAGKPPLKVVKR